MNEPGFAPECPVYTPSELNREVKLHLEAGFPQVVLEAEISNLSRPASGHLYFSLKDETAQIRSAMFRSAVLRSSLHVENGMKVLARGRISLYEARGEYQFIVDGLRDAGQGALLRQFEQLKKKLESEGLFEPERKQALPPYPMHIGVITSASGAAVRDIEQVLQRRWPVAQVRLYPVSVQGADAPGEICAALAQANRECWAEVLILGRGGGSIEDLQAFNMETVARSVAASSIPVISAVGHETDFSISDFVADVRAPTPSAAAELATPDQYQVRAAFARFQRMLEQRMQAQLQRNMQGLDYLAHRLLQRDPARRLREQNKQLARLAEALERSTRARVRETRYRLTGATARLNMQHPGRKLDEYRQRIMVCQQAADRSIRSRLLRTQDRFHDLGRTLHAVSPLATMGRGYAVLSATMTGAVITHRQQVDSGSQLTAQLADGRLYCTVDSTSNEALEASQFVPRTESD
jgi:exodeoxyribonuclease VII large subunit